MTTIPTNNYQVVLPDPPHSQRRPFLTPIPDRPGEFLMSLDNTSLDKIKRCHKAGENYLIHLREGRPHNAALTFGGAIHAGLEVFNHWEVTKDEAKYGPDVQNQTILRYFSEHPSPPDDYRTPAVALEVLKHYRNRCNTQVYPDYEWEIQADANGPIIERPFEIPMGVCDIEMPLKMFGDHLPESDSSRTDSFWLADKSMIARIHLAWSGRIDLIAKVAGHVHIVDHKTSSIDSEQFLQSFQFSSQTIGYTWAARTLFPNLDVSRFALNCIKLKKPTGSSGLTDRGPRGGDPALSFFRSYFEYSSERISRWVNDTQLLIEDFLHSLARGHFPLNDRSCFDKFGRCPYFDCCAIDNEASGHRLLHSDAYANVTWTPLT